MSTNSSDYPYAAFSRNAESYTQRRYTYPVPSSPEERSAKRRRTWATIAFLLSLTAVAVEAGLHLCASELFDPMPDVVTGIAYAWVFFALCFNEATLGTPDKPSQNPFILWLGRKRAAGIALAGTGVALLVAGMATWMFLPFLAIAPFLIISGVGNLILVPCLDLIILSVQFFALRRLWRTEGGGKWDRRATIGALALGVSALFFLIARPMLIGRWTAQALHTTGTTQQRAFTGLRVLHGQSAMLDLTYHHNPAYWVCFGYKAGAMGFWPWLGYDWQGEDWQQREKDLPVARRTYFLLTGTPYESMPRPDSETRQTSLGDPGNVAVEETGGYVVGRPVPGLSLDTSDLQFTADTATEITVGTWTMVFRNDTNDPQEARADILLPPGATSHQVSLWIDGVEHPAAYSSPQKVRATYQQIAVVQHRDPLLVTMPAPDHLLAQCFPVPAHSTMKIKLGITAPLQWRPRRSGADRQSQLLWTCPAFGPVNFAIPSRLNHTLTLTTPTGAPLATPTLRGSDIFAPPLLLLPVSAANSQQMAALRPDALANALPTAPIDVYLLRDASQGMDDLLTPTLQDEIQHVLATLPADSQVISEDTTGTRIPDTSNTAPRYVGGTDPAPALERLLQRARETDGTNRPAVVIFLHAASPANVSNLDGVRHELQRGIGGGPALVSIQLAPQAQDAVAMDLAGFSTVYARRALPDNDGSLADALHYALQAARYQYTNAHQTPLIDAPLPLGGHAPAVNGTQLPTRGPERLSEPAALAALRQSSRTTADWYISNAMSDFNRSVDLRIAAGAPAAHAHLVTPLSSAIVLETHEQYKQNDLDDPEHPKAKDAKKAAPDIQVNAPEPGAGVLAAIGVCLLIAVGGRRRMGNE